VTIRHKDGVRDSHISRILKWIYERLYSTFGPQGWWPGDTAFEIAIGAILTQNTAWSNVTRAIRNLKRKGLLEPDMLNAIDALRLSELIRPTGYYKQKAKRLKEFTRFLFSKYEGSLDIMFKNDLFKLRQELLEINGIGLETADSILLYGGNMPIFVVDAYTKRILSRHNIVDDRSTYSKIQGLFMDNLPNDPSLFNEFHALIVKLGKEVCKKRPKCSICPLKGLKDVIRYICDSCGRPLIAKEIRYILKMEIYASEDVNIDKRYLEMDHRIEMERIIEEIKDMDEKRLREDVYINYKFNLCKRCKDKLNKRIVLKEFI